MKTSKKQKTFFEEVQGTTDEIIKQIRRLIKKGNARRVMIQNKKGKVLFQMQLTAGLAGSTLISFMSPLVSAIGMFALLFTDMKVVVEKYPADQLDEDEYEVDADAEVIVEIEDEEEEAEDAEEASKKNEKANKTVGKEEE